MSHHTNATRCKIHITWTTTKPENLHWRRTPPSRRVAAVQQKTPKLIPAKSFPVHQSPNGLMLHTYNRHHCLFPQQNMNLAWRHDWTVPLNCRYELHVQKTRVRPEENLYRDPTLCRCGHSKVCGRPGTGLKNDRAVPDLCALNWPTKMIISVFLAYVYGATFQQSPYATQWAPQLSCTARVLYVNAVPASTGHRQQSSFLRTNMHL